MSDNNKEEENRNQDWDFSVTTLISYVAGANVSSGLFIYLFIVTFSYPGKIDSARMWVRKVKLLQFQKKGVTVQIIGVIVLQCVNVKH